MVTEDLVILEYSEENILHLFLFQGSWSSDSGAPTWNEFSLMMDGAVGG